MNILLIGSEGYVGSGLMFYLMNRGHTVEGINKQKSICSLNKDYFVKNSFDTVINCATVMDRSSSNYDISSASHKINVKAVENIIGYLQNLETTFIQISSKDIYGDVYNENNTTEGEFSYTPHFLVNEKHPINPMSPYAKSKYISEVLSESYKKTVTIRICTCYTDFYRPDKHWIPSIIDKIINKETITLTGRGKQFRDLLHVNDLGMLIENITSSNLRGTLINAGGGSSNIQSLLEFIKNIDPNPSLQFVGSGDFGFAFDSSLANKLYQWTPSIKLLDRLPLMIENIKNKKRDP